MLRKDDGSWSPGAPRGLPLDPSPALDGARGSPGRPKRRVSSGRFAALASSPGPGEGKAGSRAEKRPSCEQLWIRAAAAAALSSVPRGAAPRGCRRLNPPAAPRWSPGGGAEGQVEALRATLRSLVGLILSCLVLLFLLGGSLLLGCRPAFRRARGRGLGQAPPASPRLWQVVPGAPAVRPQAGSGAAAKQLPRPPRDGCSAGRLARSLPPPCCRGRAALTHSSRGQTPGARPSFRSPAPPRGQAGHGAAPGAASLSSSPDKYPALVPPNSPVTTSGTGGVPGGAFTGSCLTSTQEKLRSCSTSTAARPAPFEYYSSIQCEGARAQLNSANFTDTQGPGLDTDFGASAGVSVRILSSDSEDSPGTPLLRRQRSGRFEWDYYDPSFETKGRAPPQLPPISSKQYWL